MAQGQLGLKLNLIKNEEMKPVAKPPLGLHGGIKRGKHK